MKVLQALAIGFCISCLPVMAQQSGEKAETSDSVGHPRFWQASVPGGSFLVALDKITSVSRHKYILDGSVVVDEVTIDTYGQGLARFYFISPISDELPGSTAGLIGKGIDRVQELADDKLGDTHNMVVKKYPVTTHAKSIEYRLLSAEQLNDLEGSVTKAWKAGKGRTFKAD